MTTDVCPVCGCTEWDNVYQCLKCSGDGCQHATAEIERLRAVNAELVEALQGLCAMATECVTEKMHDYVLRLALAHNKALDAIANARIAREAKGLQMSQADYVSAKVMGRL